MAIQGISFMGKEGCIEPTVKKIAKETKTYMGKEPIGEIKKTAEEIGEKLGSLRPSDVNAYKISHSNIELKPEPTGDEIAKAWKAAHGIQ